MMKVFTLMAGAILGLTGLVQGLPIVTDVSLLMASCSFPSLSSLSFLFHSNQSATN